jgi:hypothetical protein
VNIEIMRKDSTKTIAMAVGLILTSLSWLPALSFASCDRSAAMGDWKKGTESREEAEAYQTRELAETLDKFLDCLDETMPLKSARSLEENQSRVSAANDVSGGDEGEKEKEGERVNSADQESTANQGEETGDGEQGVAGQSRDSNGSLNPPHGPIDSDEIDLEGSYAKALREAYAAETNPKIKAALAVEYKKLTGRLID